jgi:hypothetical protein
MQRRAALVSIHQPNAVSNIGLEEVSRVTTQNGIELIPLIDPFKETGSMKMSALILGDGVQHPV